MPGKLEGPLCSAALLCHACPQHVNLQQNVNQRMARPAAQEEMLDSQDYADFVARRIDKYIFWITLAGFNIGEGCCRLSGWFAVSRGAVRLGYG